MSLLFPYIYKSCVASKLMLSYGIKSFDVCLTQGAHSAGHGHLGEFRAVGLLVLR